MHGDYQVFLGLDVGKDGHHAVALSRDGKRLYDTALVNTEAKVRQVFDKLAKHGPVLVVVDQPASIGALPVAVARARGHQVAHLPGLTMRRIADLHPGYANAFDVSPEQIAAVGDTPGDVPMLRTARISVYVGTTLPDDFTPTWHLPAAPIDEIARIIVESDGGHPPPSTR